MDRNMIGFEREWFTLQNADGHDLALNQINLFLTLDIAVEKAKEAAVDYKDTVLITKHKSRIVKAIRTVITTEEVSDTTTVTS